MSLRRWFSFVAVIGLILSFAGAQPSRAASLAPIRIGAVFPLRGSIGVLARQEFSGVEIARDLVNRDGGVAGRRIVLDVRELDTPAQSPAVMRSLRAAGVTTVIGAYSSALSIPASTSASGAGMVYWEAGAVADRLTGRGLPRVFRIGASGWNLGSNSLRFAAQQLAWRLGKRPDQLRISIVQANDDYAVSVAAAAVAVAHLESIRIASRTMYDPYAPRWRPAIAAVRKARPDILVLVSHIPDGIAFRRQMLAAHLHVGAMIGSTMAQCLPDFGAALGRDAVGVFASDRPGGTFNPRALDGPARQTYARFAAAWQAQTGLAQPTEEGIAGFSAAWALFHDVLPRAARHGALSSATIAAAARSTDLPPGSLPNGAGVRFATDRQHLGQNDRPAAVIWQWQGVRHSVVVWPRLYATGTVKMVPLPR